MNNDNLTESNMALRLEHHSLCPLAPKGVINIDSVHKYSMYTVNRCKYTHYDVCINQKNTYNTRAVHAV